MGNNEVTCNKSERLTHLCVSCSNLLQVISLNFEC